MEAERTGQAFLVHRDADGAQVIALLSEGRPALTIGRSAEADLPLEFDEEASRFHAELMRISGEWLITDDGLSTNGTFVNAERVVSRRRLRDGDTIRVGSTALLYRAPGEPTESETVKSGGWKTAADVTEAQKRVLVALCRPILEAAEPPAPATNKAIADEVFLSVDAVKAHLRVLFDRFDLAELAQNEKRLGLAEAALRSGVVSRRDLGS
jgi:pSer/pThr/pTyr-binding forkhead associated (FHA) protein